MRVGAVIILACLASVSIASPTPGPPYNTDDPEPVDYMHWEAYVASQYLNTREGSTGTEPHFEFNYGVVPNVQLHLITPLAFNDPAGETRQYGYGDTEVGVKYRFQQETRTKPMVGIFPLVELPTGAASNGLGSGRAQFFLPVWIQKDLGSGWTTYGGGGFWRNPGAGNRDYWFLGWQAQKQVTKQCAVGGELFHQTPNTVDGEARTAFNVGAVYDFDDGHHLMFSIGRDLHGPDTGSAYVAYQWTFGPHEKRPEG